MIFQGANPTLGVGSLSELEFYNYLFGLDYIGVSFKLKMGGRSLEELSPGERGIVLLSVMLSRLFIAIWIRINMP